ncbi:hypothetical protein JGUZn3_17650 [Entomobacter blattae]|uniref:Uncharacterized protein n=1 Tax=Entomobacter blattae TaxID=2762277 RepID=A0A7H1NT72_9PROT|nr:hypothetical protein JGUZn3_17650 [Entomobacter blattae]
MCMNAMASVRLNPVGSAVTRKTHQEEGRFSNLPSSFSIVLSSALVYSTSPPVSVSGTVYTPELFPGMLKKLDQSNKA